MHTNFLVGCWLLIAIGVLYIIKPTIFRRGIWTETSIAQRMLSPQGYIRYMRGVGVVSIVTGILFLIWGYHRA